jgi:hypothetical protein
MSVRLDSSAAYLLFRTLSQKHEKPQNSAAFDFTEIGAGEGIRTLDPNLGKVLLGLSGAIPFYPTALHTTDK